MTQPPRVLLEEWLPAAAIGVECIRERGSASALAPHTYLHVWWARRPLVASRAAVLGSLLPADFPREVFERLLGFGMSGNELVKIRRLLDEKPPGTKLKFGFECKRAFRQTIKEDDIKTAHKAIESLWGNNFIVLDPMAGGGSIPHESARMGFTTIANEYNPVACSILEAIVDYPFRFGLKLAQKGTKWGKKLEERVCKLISMFFPDRGNGFIKDYVFARTVPCPETGWDTPLVPDWHLLKPKNGRRLAAQPQVNNATGAWWIEVKEVGDGKGQLKEVPKPTYSDGKGVSLFTNLQIPPDYLKAMAQQGRMGSALYAVVLKTPQGLKFERPTEADLKALEAAAAELARLRPGWEQANIIPTEVYPEITTDERPRLYGMPRWADLFSPRQLLAMGVLVEELQRLRPEIIQAEGEELGEAVVHILAMGLNKFLNHNCYQSRWENTRAVIKGKMDRHDYAFKPAFAEMAPCHAGAGLAWALENVLEAYENLAKLPRHPEARPVEIHHGSAASLPQIADGSVTAVVVDPPYADNVQYAELADFFYVWLKRTQGHRRPEWFSTYLCGHDQEAVVNVSRHRAPGAGKKAAAVGRAQAQVFYQEMMTRVFGECRRVLRDDGVLTVMFTHKKQEAWASLFSSLIEAGFMITATWPVKTESEHSLHQANKNAAQSTVILVARKRPPEAQVGYFDGAMQEAIRREARTAAARLAQEGLNRVDQLVGAFGPAMEVFSRFAQVRTDTGLTVGVAQALEEAASAVSAWRLAELAPRGLEGVEGEGRFYLLCWDVLGAAEFRFNEAKLLGHAVGMDVEQLVAAGLVTKEGDKIKIFPAKERRRDQALKPEEVMDTLFGPVTVPRKHTRKQVLKIHPNDPSFRTVLDACQALALRYLEAGGGAGGIGSARALMRQQGWTKDSLVPKLMAALVQSAPEAVRHEKGKQSAAARFPEFRAWHSLLMPLFEVEPPDWTEQAPPELPLFKGMAGGGSLEEDLEDLEAEEESESEE
jgi:putative DNA methylase